MFSIGLVSLALVLNVSGQADDAAAAREHIARADSIDSYRVSFVAERTAGGSFAKLSPEELVVLLDGLVTPDIAPERVTGEVFANVRLDDPGSGAGYLDVILTRDGGRYDRMTKLQGREKTQGTLVTERVLRDDRYVVVANEKNDQISIGRAEPPSQIESLRSFLVDRISVLDEPDVETVESDSGTVYRTNKSTILIDRQTGLPRYSIRTSGGTSRLQYQRNFREDLALEGKPLLPACFLEAKWSNGTLSWLDVAAIRTASYTAEIDSEVKVPTFTERTVVFDHRDGQRGRSVAVGPHRADVTQIGSSTEKFSNVPGRVPGHSSLLWIGLGVFAAVTAVVLAVLAFRR